MEELIRILFKWFKPISWVCAIAAIGSIVVSLVLPEYFTSNVTFIPMNPHLMDRSTIFQTEAGGEPVYLFGGKGEINRILTLAESRELETYIVTKYNLYDHYEIDKDDPLAPYEVSEAFKDYIRATKTSNSMITVSVMDKDKQLAADIANDILVKLDEMNKNLMMSKKRSLTKMYEEKVQEREKVVTALRDSLHNVLQANPDDTITANLMDVLIERAVRQYASVKRIFDEHLTVVNQEFSSLYVIETAVPAVKRTKPVRSLIVISTVLLSFLAMLMLAVFIEKFKHFDLSEPKAV